MSLEEKVDTLPEAPRESPTAPQHTEKSRNVYISKEEERGPGVIGEMTDPNVRFVLSGQPTGWAAMAETVREYDEDKVKDVKEDMDSLFIFVRIFPASMNATNTDTAPKRPVCSPQY